MCFPKANVPSAADNAAETARLEAERSQRVRDTSAAVNSTFDERFGPDYYKGIGDSFRDYYKPQVAEQFADASRSNTLRYADRANSSAANRTTANLYRDRLRADQDIDFGATDAAAKAKGDVEGKRASLIGLAEAGGSMENTAALARGATVQPTAFSPIGDIFGKYANTLSTAARASDSGSPINPVWQKQIDFMRGGSKGSQRVVGG